MRDFFNRFCRTISFVFVVVAMLAFEGCSMVTDNTLGSDIMPEGQVMVMRHLKFQGNKIISFNATTGENEVKDASLDGKNFLETRLYRTDSLISSNLNNGYMGMRRSDVFGLRTAGFASTMLYMNAIDEEKGFGYLPIFDTMKMVMTISNYGGDTLVPIRYKVYELLKPLAKSLFSETDSVAYINCDLSEVYDESKPIFEFTFPNSELGEGPATIMVPMEPTPYSWDFARRLMLIPDNYADAGSDWDGYGRSGIECYTDDKQWVDKFHGVYIKPESAPSDKEGAIYELDLTASGMMLQGRSRNPKDPSMIQDTVGMYYYFKDSDSDYNRSVNRVERDYSQSLSGGDALLNDVVMDCTVPRENRSLVSTCYVEGMGGPSTEIYFTDDMLDELLSLEQTASEESMKVGINQCLLTIYVKGASYDWETTQNNATILTPLLDNSFVRLGGYTNYNTLSPVFDYDYVYENNNDSESLYGGYLDRSRGCYVMNITAHLQRLFNYAKSVRQEDGSYLFDENAQGYVGRSIYIGTEVVAPYSFSETTLQGMEDDMGAILAPIEIDLTYTLIK
ncbi:MAG: DUF4270 family protein [Alistipes sp.]|nr:DUF4270 family protein [Alistipes sp.]